uniref:STI1 domain-containing protein n=1 Tax=Florenciella parvula TaxID=236787 RepID=A0A7S2F8P4_9STRA
MRFIKFVVSAAVLCAAPVECGLFKNKEKEQAENDAAARAMADVQTGFDGLRQATADPAMLADVMESMKDPEIMAEARKMMEDPAFQAQMKQFSNQKGFKDAAAKVKEQFADLQANPEKMEMLNNQVEGFLASAKAAKVEQAADGAQDARSRARNAAGMNDFGMNLPGAKESTGGAAAALGVEALADAARNPALMAEAMEQMQDPEVMREVRKLMQDPSFAAQIKAMQDSPQFKNTMSESAAMMQELMKDPAAAEKLKRRN